MAAQQTDPVFGDALAAYLEPRIVKVLEKAFGYQTVGELLWHLPRRYHRRGEPSNLGELVEGQYVTVLATVEKLQRRTTRNRKTLTEVTVTDGVNRMNLVFFNRYGLERQLVIGRTAMFSGTVGSFQGKRQLAHPEFEPLPDLGDNEDEELSRFANEIIPLYPATAKCSSATISRAIRIVLDQVDFHKVSEPIPDVVRAEHDLPDLKTTFNTLHRPTDTDDLTSAMNRLRWQEALILQTALVARKHAMSQSVAIARTGRRGGLVDALDARLPFTLTDEQSAVSQTISDDLSHEFPMHRLLQGEVGSGKTVVALRAMLAVVDSGGQAALLAPTEVLAAQHERTIRALLGPLADGGTLMAADNATGVTLLTGSLSAAQRRQALLDIASGSAGIVIGTHALLEDSVEFADLGLVVIDEQHRFGVEQRAALAERGRDATRPHMLVMTATPIPRTVAITVFGDLDISTIRQLPAGRSPITSHVVFAAEAPHFLQRAWERVREEVDAGRQVYIVCSQIDQKTSEQAESDPLDALFGDEPIPQRTPASVQETLDELTAGPLVGLRVEALHGRMSAEEKDDVFRRFASGPAIADGIDVLIATTVIEVGVDVPNATMMVVLDADRFGMSTLHQLRGRVGRGQHAGLCLLVTWAASDSSAGQRLTDVAATLDGFELARLDLSLRREGNVLGHTQSGRRSSLRVLQVVRDEKLIGQARQAAEQIVSDDPLLQEHPPLRRAVAELFDEEDVDWLERS